jgi:hypothetical protein
VTKSAFVGSNSRRLKAAAAGTRVSFRLDAPTVEIHHGTALDLSFICHRTSENAHDTNGLLPSRGLECCPRHVWNNMPCSIQQSDICRLHERVDKNNFKNAFVLSISHMLAFLRGGDFGFSWHFLLRLASSIINGVGFCFLVCRGRRRSDCSYPVAIRFSLQDDLARLHPLFGQAGCFCRNKGSPHGCQRLDLFVGHNDPLVGSLALSFARRNPVRVKIMSSS